MNARVAGVGREACHGSMMVTARPDHMAYLLSATLLTVERQGKRRQGPHQTCHSHMMLDAKQERMSHLLSDGLIAISQLLMRGLSEFNDLSMAVRWQHVLTFRHAEARMYESGRDIQVQIPELGAFLVAMR